MSAGGNCCCSFSCVSFVKNTITLGAARDNTVVGKKSLRTPHAFVIHRIAQTIQQDSSIARGSISIALIFLSDSGRAATQDQLANF